MGESKVGAAAPSSPALIIPAAVEKMLIGIGSYRKYMKCLAWGEAGGGKSKFGSQFPNPILALDTGDGGISGYLTDPRDKVMRVESYEDFEKAYNFLMNNASYFSSLVLDNATILWEDWMDHFNKKFNGDIVGGQWKDVKAPWKLKNRRFQRMPMHVLYTAWVDDIDYTTRPGGPGEKSKLLIKAQDLPKIEKRLPHAVDLILKFAIKRNELNAPTSVHEVTVTKCRRPASVAPTDLFVGKTWEFDERRETNIWDLIVEPIRSKWAADDHAVESLGGDSEEEQADEIETDQMAEDYTVGRLTRAIQEATTMEELAHVFKTQIAPVSTKLAKPAYDAVEAAKNRRKAELEAK